MPSITSWTRLEPRARDETLNTSLEARIQDPLWLLARQWQFGEFSGEDAASLVRAELQIETSQLERYCPDSPPDAARSQDYDNQVPLETRVEREPVLRANSVQARLAAEAGLQFFRFLGEEMTAQYRTKFLDTFTLLFAEDQQYLDRAGARFLSVVEKRVLDGAKIYQVLVQQLQTGQPVESIEPFKTINSEGNWATKVKPAVEKWLGWYEMYFSEPQDDPAWVRECMEYSFAVSAPIKTSGTPDELVLVASEYSEGHLDWHSFEIDTEPTHKLGARGQEIKSRFITVIPTPIPTPIRFRGMPASRWWEFEDAGVNFGGVEAAREDLARLMLTEFALIYGNDFFVIPMDLDVGSICRVDSLQVTNTFGEISSISPASQADQMNHDAAPWRMFCLSTLNERLAKQKVPTEFLFLPPVLGWTLESEPVEEVLLLRDEMANMAWAVERIVESTAGGILNRFETYQRQEQDKEQAEPGSTAPPSGPLGYRLVSSVPPYWLPLIPEHTNSTDRNIVLRLAGPPQGRILWFPIWPLIRPLTVNEEQVPRDGVRVTRTYQYARWIDGSTHLWVGRRKETGRGEGSSGLRFDIVGPA